MRQIEPWEVVTSVAIPGPTRPGRFVDRLNRYAVRVVLEPEEATVEAHLPDPSRHRDLLVPDARMWVRPEEGPRRSAPWTAILVQSPSGGLVSLDPLLAHRVVATALAEDAIGELPGYEVQRADVPFGTSRFDFELRDTLGQRAYLDVESVTAVENGVALFPDAPNERSVRQLRSLARAVSLGTTAGAVMFIVSRVDARLVMAARHIDPEYTDALREAQEAGVRLMARRCQVTLQELVLGVPLEVRVPPPAAR